MDIRERVKFVRLSLGLSQKEFGERIGKALRTIQDWESGRRNIPDSALRLISQTFGVSYEWLKTGKGEIWEKREEPPEWLKEFMKEASDEDIELVHAFIQLLKHAKSKEDKELLKLFLKKVAPQGEKKDGS